MKNMQITSDYDNEECNTGLCLGLGLMGGGHVVKMEKKFPSFDLPLDQLSPKSIKLQQNHHNNNKGAEIFNVLQERQNHHATSSTDSDHHNDDQDRRRKKLRLTKEQSSTLENTFKLHNTLNPIEKKALAEQLKLKTRQIEVWFQNRRARTKLKQTEVDYELLKKYCQNLSDENKRLKKELQELKSPLCPQHLSKVTATVCSSCDHKLFKENTN